MIFLTVDRTRVGIAVGALPVLLMLRFAFEKTDLLETSIGNFRIYFLVYLFIPQLIITDFDVGGLLRLPYKEFFKLILH